MILIVGAGLAGLSLGRTLLKQGVPFRIFDQSPGDRFQGYGLTLHDSTMHHLLEMLQMDEPTLRDKVAVSRVTPYLPQSICDALTGELYGTEHAKFNAKKHKSFRTNRERLWKLIRGDLEVEYNYKLIGLENREGSVIAEFANGERVQGSLLVAGDGVHSFIRKTLLPQIVSTDWQGEMFNGIRKVSKIDFERDYAPYMEGLAVKIGVYDNCLLAITVYDVDEADGAVSISWGWSQRRRGDNDPLFVPYAIGKEKWRAAPLPWDDLEQLPPLAKPWENIYHDSKLRQDYLIRQPLLNHLIPMEDLKATLRNRKVAFIGDSARAYTNHAGTAGNTAIVDGIALGQVLIRGQPVETLYDRRYEEWKKVIAFNNQISESLHRSRDEWLRNKPATNGTGHA